MPGKGNNLYLGTSGDGMPIVLQHEDRLEHMLVVGNTGSGKSRYVRSHILQDLKSWSKTKCGFMVIDPDGQTFDAIMAFMTANKLFHLPIVPIDFRQRDTVVSYNVLRQRSAEPSVIIDNFVRAMAHVWGAGGTNETPLFERWAFDTLFTLYQEKRTLADAGHLFTPEGQVITERITDPMIRQDWEWARRNQKDFQTAVMSSVNRFRRFLLSPVMRSIFGQGEVSLDLGTALEQGQIIVVSLATDGGFVSRQNVDLFATLLISDLQVACDERGKRDTVKPFYLYLDEFWRFVTPTMAQNLAAARGFGLGMTMVTQYPQQILDSGPHGQRIFNEIMENTLTKVVFRLHSQEDLELVTDHLFFPTYDPMRVKYQHRSTKVLRHEVRYMSSYGTNSTATEGGGKQRSRTKGSSKAVAANWSHSDSSTRTVGTSESHTDGESAGMTIGMSESESDGEAETAQWSRGESAGVSAGRNWSDGEGATAGGNRSRSHSENVSQDLGEPADDLKKDITRGGRRPEYRELLEQSDGFGKHQFYLDDANQRVSIAENDGTTEGESWGKSTNSSRGGSESLSRQSSLSEGGSRGRNSSLSRSLSAQLSTSTTSSDTYGSSESFAESTADSYGGSETIGTNEAKTIGVSSQWSNAAGRSTTCSPMLIPIIGKEAEAPVFFQLEEQRFLAMQSIFSLAKREAFILGGDMRSPAFIRTADMYDPKVTTACTNLCIEWYLRESGLALPLEVVKQQIYARDAEFTGRATGDAECESPRRRIAVAVVVKPAHQR